MQRDLEIERAALALYGGDRPDPANLNWTFPRGRSGPVRPTGAMTMKVKFGEVEHDWNPLFDTPRLVAVGQLLLLNPTQAIALKTVGGAVIELRVNDMNDALRQVI